MAKLGRSVVGFLALVFAIILLVLSIDVFDMSIDPTYDGYTEHEIYGGDAYTGIQNAAADTANAAATSARRMGKLNNTVVYIGGGLLLGASFAFFVASAWMFVGCIVDTASAVPKTVIPTYPPAASQSDNTCFWVCPECGKRNTGADNTCSACWTKHWICMQCGARNSSKNRECINCQAPRPQMDGYFNPTPNVPSEYGVCLGCGATVLKGTCPLCNATVR